MTRTGSSLAVRLIARGVTTLSLCSLALLGSPNASHAILGNCITPASDLFNDGVADGDGVSGCTANDMGVAGITNVVVLDDGCTSIGDTVTISGTIVFNSSMPKRYDVAAYIATNGTDGLDIDSNGPQCDVHIIPAPSSPTDDGDQCGDYDGGLPAVTMTVTSTTFSCVDLLGNDGLADLQVCSSYKQNASSTGEDGCPNYTGAVPGTSSKCRCSQVTLTPPIPIHQCASGPCCDTSVSPHVFRTAGTTCRGAAGVCDLAEVCSGTSSTCPVDAFSASSVPCRSSAGICDSAENCTGSSASCPADTFQPTSVTCRASSGAICDVAETCTGTGAACPADAFASAATPCRASGGVCDVAETCTGSSSVCPANTRLGTTTTCRAADGSCDVAEVCTGTADSCPTDSFLGTTTTCRSSAGNCDIAEVCSGLAASCPADSFLGTTTTCRASGGVCDIAEVCSGTAATCPNDSFQSSSTTCRADAGDCDVAETCTGADASCPADGFESPGTSCGDGTDTICTNPDTCNGSGTCLPNHEPGTTVCRADAGECDVAETCDGAGSCPADVFEANGTSCGDGTDSICTDPDTCQAGVCDPNDEPTSVTCRADAGECDVAETCDGAGECPADAFAAPGTSCGDGTDTICDNADTCDGSGSCQDNNEPGTTVCRADAGQCDVEETCDGAGNCPADAFESDGTSCGNPADSICDNPDTCSAGSCVTNNEPSTTVCRADAGECDVEETCDGAGSCPADAFEVAGTSCGDDTDTVCSDPDTCDGAGSCETNDEPATTVCRADTGECDVAETCDGAGECPADAFEAPGTSCGDDTDTVCSNPDTCDGSGSCDANDEPSTTVCRADAGECDVAETCDGAGSCPADAFESDGTSCGNPADSVCDNPDTCSAGSCVTNNEPGTTVCRADTGECDVEETCDGAGSCPADAFEAPGTSCGNGTDTVCSDPDTCDGAGNCDANDEPATTVCRSDTGECDVEETCDGAGSCPADAFEAAGTSCGDGTDTVCSDPDTCDGAGSCEANDEPSTTVCRADAGECDVEETCDGAGECPADAFEAAGTSCGDDADTVCSDPDTCDGAGSCEANDEPATTVCRADTGECDVEETCDGAGDCPADAFAAPGTSCGDGTDTVCSDPDTCDGAGSCEANDEPSTTVCRADAGDCDVEETCDGAGSCPADAFEAPGTSCGDGADTVCSDPDTCDGSGSCEANDEPSTTVCRADAGQCDVAETCDGAGNCPADAFEAPGTSCGDGADTVCSDPDTCDGAGSCDTNDEPSTTVCRADAGECDVAETCDGNGSCPADAFEAAGTSCGDGTDTVCSDPDTCDGSGTCEANHESITVECRGSAGQCDIAETCDGAGNCPADAFEPSGEPCGNPGDTVCDDPDTCDGSGSCQTNNEANTVVCRADAGECDVAETCDGAGSCPADAFEADGTSCGDGTDTVCDNPDTCSSGTCVANNEPIIVECRADAGECDVAEFCDGAGGCPADAFEASGTSCGDTTDTICDNADTCDGSGACQDNYEPNTVECRADAGECDAAETCDGAGNCPADAFASDGTACGSPDDDECDNPDTCTAGACEANNEPSGTACGDGTDTICDNADTCDGTGTCQANHEPGTVECRADAGECDVAENCDGAGSCPADAFEASGTSCGDATDTICDGADTCDGSGACLDNVEPGTTTCRAEAGECDAAELCDGAGGCPADEFAPSGTACGSSDDTECDNPDTCDDAGVCTANYEALGTTCGSANDTICDNADSCDGTGSCASNAEPATVLCRADTGQCDVPEFCDGGGSCPADGLEPNGTSCEDGNLCTEGETCQLGACAGAQPINCEDNDLCTAPSCDPSIGCVYEPDVAPIEDCYHSSSGRLAISDRAVAVRDVIRWTWRRGEIIDPSSFGNPLVDTQYAVCIFDQTDNEPILITSMNVPAAAPKWKAPKRGRYKYIDSPGTFDGVRKIRLIPKTKEFRSKVQFRARGVNLVLPAPFSSSEYMDVDSNVIVQLRTSENACWESTFNQSQVFRNQPTKFRAKYRFKGQYQDDVVLPLDE